MTVIWVMLWHRINSCIQHKSHHMYFWYSYVIQLIAKATIFDLFLFKLKTLILMIISSGANGFISEKKMSFEQGPKAPPLAWFQEGGPYLSKRSHFFSSCSFHPAQKLGFLSDIIPLTILLLSCILAFCFFYFNRIWLKLFVWMWSLWCTKITICY